MGELKAVKQYLSVLTSKKGKMWVMVAGAVGILLLVLPEFLPKKSTSSTAILSTQEYVEQTEERLGAIIRNIDGAGECRIMITLENGVEYVYATEQKTNSDRQEDTDDNGNKVIQRDDSEESIIVVDTGNGREGLLVTEIQPVVKGVVVVCEGGDNEEVRARIVQAVTVAMNVSAKRVCVTKLA